MDDLRISALPAADPITGAELVPVTQGGITKKTLASEFLSAVPLVGAFSPFWYESHVWTDATFLVNGGAPETLNGAAKTIDVPEDMTVVVIGELLLSRHSQESPADYHATAGYEVWLSWDDGTGEHLERGGSEHFPWLRQSVIGGLGNEVQARTLVSVWTIPLTAGSWTIQLKAYSMGGNPTFGVNRVFQQSKWTALGVRSVVVVREERVTTDGEARVTTDGEPRVI